MPDSVQVADCLLIAETAEHKNVVHFLELASIYIKELSHVFLHLVVFCKFHSFFRESFVELAGFSLNFFETLCLDVVLDILDGFLQVYG